VATPRAERLAPALARALADPALSGAQVGALVVDVRAGRVRFARQPDIRFIPASTQKLLTAAAAFVRLGPEYAWLTPVLAAGPVADGVVEGDLYVRGSGDPSFVAEQVYRLAASLRSAGVKRIEGRVVGDGSLFLEEPEPPGWALYNGPEAYRPAVGALSFSFNAVEVTVRPGGVGAPPTVLVEPRTTYIEIANRALTGPPGVVETLTVGQAAPPAEADAGPSRRARLEVTGTLPADDAPRRFTRRVQGPALYFATALRDALGHVGIEVAGSAAEGPTPPDAQPVLVHRSRALGGVLADMGKFSNNFMAEMVLRTLGVEATGAPATSAEGLKVLREVLREAGADPSQAVLVDGSGLSRLNLVTPRQLVAILIAMERRFDARAEFAAGFGLLGVDGTVQRRYADSPASRRVRAKTGSLAGVRTLAGYAEGPRGEALAFVLFVNHLLVPVERVVGAERRFVEALTAAP
jgi:D-alanyl-D-alanine carboxypeptidase/D-alanyl-D-alanine-endopeptidase (penicillin-binding protein 4)